MWITTTFALFAALCTNPGTDAVECHAVSVHGFTTIQACREAIPEVQNALEFVRIRDVEIAVYATATCQPVAYGTEV
jgi:hypothetical protein